MHGPAAVIAVMTGRPWVIWTPTVIFALLQITFPGGISFSDINLPASSTSEEPHRDIFSSNLYPTALSAQHSASDSPSPATRLETRETLPLFFAFFPTPIFFSLLSSSRNTLNRST
ncbi:hypothetical protein J3F83DRAFT_239112 [Trichoderma novae-zelandiae]